MKYSKEQIMRLEKMLLAKEQRANIQKKLIEEYNDSLISFMLNIPGQVKNSKEFVDFHKGYIEEIKKTLKEKNILILKEEYFNKETGMEYFAIVHCDEKLLKKYMVDIEERNDKTRLLDIDIFSKEYNQISRSSLNLPNRKCIVCNDDAKSCIRLEKHNINELEEKVKDIIKGC